MEEAAGLLTHALVEDGHGQVSQGFEINVNVVANAVAVFDRGVCEKLDRGRIRQGRVQHTQSAEINEIANAVIANAVAVRETLDGQGVEFNVNVVANVPLSKAATALATTLTLISTPVATSQTHLWRGTSALELEQNSLLVENT